MFVMHSSHMSYSCGHKCFPQREIFSVANQLSLFVPTIRFELLLLNITYRNIKNHISVDVVTVANLIVLPIGIRLCDTLIQFRIAGPLILGSVTEHIPQGWQILHEMLSLLKLFQACIVIGNHLTIPFMCCYFTEFTSGKELFTFITRFY